MKEIWRCAWRLISVFMLFVLIFQIQRLIFVGYYHQFFHGITAADFFSIVRHGLTLDMSVAGYLSIIPGLLAAVSVSAGNRSMAMRYISHIYNGAVAILISAVFISDLTLYGFWGFRLDFTPVFYFLSSPKDALASTSIWFTAAGLAVAAAVSAITYICIDRWTGRPLGPVKGAAGKAAGSLLLVLMTAGLFLPIRGGAGPTTMNLSEAYFSQNQKYNHAAINPVFSLLYSMSHQSRFDTQYRFMDDATAQSLFDAMKDRPVSSDIPELLKPEYYEGKRPDIVLVMLESFSTHLMKSMGGKDIAVNLDRIASEGLLFTEFYANSFRTDRATPAIISAFPAQPSTSIMKYSEKVERMPSIPNTLKQNGYDIAFYYGGDANFTNLMAFLVSCGFEKIISEKDFPASQRTGKWGANDGALFDRFLEDFLSEDTDRPRFRIVQTSSSHDPFDVPDYNVFPDIRENAFSYTDMCIGRFVRELQESGAWDNTLLIMVPDHWAAYPDYDSLDIFQRHSIPLVFSGGALALKGKIDACASQIDIAATLLYQLGIDHSEFIFSKNILNPDSPRFAFFTEPSMFGLVTADTRVSFNCDAGITVSSEGACGDAAIENGKAYLQKLYDSMEEL